jgi:hypothetical protein
MIAQQEKQSTTDVKAIYDLVKGDFSPAEASEIIDDLFNTKINFHERKNFSRQIRFGSDDLHGLQRIKELKMARELANGLITEAKKSGKSLRVNSTISIELI